MGILKSESIYNQGQGENNILCCGAARAFADARVARAVRCSPDEADFFLFLCLPVGGGWG